MKENISTNQDNTNENTILMNRISELEKEIKERDTQIETHRNLAYSFMDELQSSGNENDDTTSIKPDSCSQELEAARVVLKELEDDNKALQLKVETLYKKNVDQEASYSNQLKAMQTAINSNQETVGNVDILMKLKKLIEDKENQISQYKENDLFMNRSLEEKMAAIERLQESVKSSSTKVKILTDKVDSICAVNDNLEVLNDLLRQKMDVHRDNNETTSVKLPEIEHERVETRSNLITSDRSWSPERNSQYPPKINGLSAKPTIETVQSKFCFSEIRRKDSCSRGINCKFSHKIPSELQEDNEKGLQFIRKKSPCVNEFLNKGSCRNVNCKFNHEITEAEKQDSNLQWKMKEKLRKMRDRNSNTNSGNTNRNTTAQGLLKQLESILQSPREMRYP